MTLDDLFAELDRYDRRIPLGALNEHLQHLEIDPTAIEPFVKFSDDHYRRNLMRAGPVYHALILCWKNGQRSPIHDHGQRGPITDRLGSTCGVRVLRGTATETVFERTPAGHLYAVRSSKLAAGHTCGTQDDDIHQVSAIEPDGSDLVTLHIYSPPLLIMGTYSLMNTHVGNFVDRVYQFCEGEGI